MPRKANANSYGQKTGNEQGNGPKKGNRRAGRPTKSFYEYLKDLRTSAAVQAAFKQALSDPNCKGFAAALRVLSEYDSERPALKRETSGVVSVKVEVAREVKRDVAQVHSQEALSPSTLKAIAEASSAATPEPEQG